MYTFHIRKRALFVQQMKRIPSTSDWVEHLTFSVFLEFVDFPTFCSLMSLNKKLFQLAAPMLFDKFGSCASKRQKVALFVRFRESVATTKAGLLFSKIFRIDSLCRYYVIMHHGHLFIGNFRGRSCFVRRSDSTMNFVLLFEDPRLHISQFPPYFKNFFTEDAIVSMDPDLLLCGELFTFEKNDLQEPLSQRFLDECSARIGWKVELIK
jgi:hypothetical protein